MYSRCLRLLLNNWLSGRISNGVSLRVIIFGFLCVYFNLNECIIYAHDVKIDCINNIFIYHFYNDSVFNNNIYCERVIEFMDVDKKLSFKFHVMGIYNK